jgi:hypothetical protein
MQARLLRPTSNGAPIVAIEGAVYTALGPMEVPDGRQPSAMQLYFLDGGDGVKQQRLLLADRNGEADSKLRFLVELLEVIL